MCYYYQPKKLPKVCSWFVDVAETKDMYAARVYLDCFGDASGLRIHAVEVKTTNTFVTAAFATTTARLV